MRSFQHWTPRYIWNRLALMAHERQHPDLPWLTRAMIENLDTWLRPDDVGLEFGSGRSTVWFAQKVGHLTVSNIIPDGTPRSRTVFRKCGGG